MKKQFVTRIDDSAENLAEITVSGGKLGMQITLTPQDLCKACRGEFAQIIHIAE